MMYMSWIVLVVACLLQETWAVSLKNTRHEAYISSVIKSMHDLNAAAEHAVREKELSSPDVNAEQVVEGADATEDALSDVELLNTINDINERLYSLEQSIQTVMENQFQITTRLSVLESVHEDDEVQSDQNSSPIQESEATQPPAPEDNLTDDEGTVDQSPLDSIDAMQQLLGNAEDIIQDAMDLLGADNVEQGVGNEGAAPGPLTVAPTPQATTIPPKTEPPKPLLPVEDIVLAQQDASAGGQQNAPDTAVEEDQQSVEGNENAQAQVTTAASNTNVQPTRKPLAGESAGQRSGQRPATTLANIEGTEEPQSATTAAPESESGNEENNDEQQQSGAEQEEAEDNKETEQQSEQQEQQGSQITTQPPPPVTTPISIEGEQRELGDYHRYSFRGYNHFTDARRDDLLRRIRINLSQRQVPLAPQPYVVRERVPLDKGGYRRPVSQT